MSNQLAIATVTETLANFIIKNALDAVQSGIPCTTRRPDQPASDEAGDPRVNLFLFHLTRNSSFRNAHLPTGRGTPPLQMRAALDLHYLVTFYGDPNALWPERLAATTIVALESTPILSADAIDASIQANPDLAGSDLASQVEKVRLTPLAMSLEELSKIWSVFFQTPYQLSIAYRASVLLLDGKAAAAAGPPVKDRTVTVTAVTVPVIDELASADSGEPPFVPSSVVLIQGRQLRGDVGTWIRIGPQRVQVLDAGPTQISVDLVPYQLAAGQHHLTVEHAVEFGSPLQPRPLITSRPVPLTIHPTLLSVSLVGDSLECQVTPDVTEKQNVDVVLHPHATDEPGHGFVTVQETASATAQFTIADVPAGSYQARLKVEGVVALGDPIDAQVTVP